MAKVAGVNEVVPLRDQIVDGAAGDHAAQHGARLAERHAALHAARALRTALFFAQQRVKFIVMGDALER
ncbi:hypothetical protein SDC9_155765 [bioreactor metagenome]|uniref:Uncharacterized protein n=1 Tax=bioreactor metagenome TaxID=1076179 RepID=A0A645F7M3_9ZZZZ